MNTNDSIASAINALRPSLVSASADRIRSTYARLLDAFGNSNTFPNVYNTHSYFTFQFILPACRKEPVDPSVPSSLRRTAYILDGALVSKYAEQLADASICAWIARITSKVDELTDVQINHIQDWVFRIQGMRDGHMVDINQDMILNVSCHGKLFNQFPARIRMDGKPVSEAKYKATFSGTSQGSTKASRTVGPKMQRKQYD